MDNIVLYVIVSVLYMRRYCNMKLTNPIFTAKVVSYERLSYNPKVWFKA